jgi:hypothetical protein
MNAVVVSLPWLKIVLVGVQRAEFPLEIPSFAFHPVKRPSAKPPLQGDESDGHQFQQEMSSL